MNVFLLTDVEGLAGVNDILQMDRSKPEYQNTRKLLCDSINLAVSVCFDNGATQVFYLDGHAGGGNVFEELIDKRAQKCSLDEWCELLKNGEIDCQIELGSHSRAGTIGGFLDHTISSKAIFSIKINGVEMSEQSLHAALCGKFGVPVVAVIGDEAVCRQAKEYIPNVFVGAVKNATVRNTAETYQNADEILQTTIAEALKNYQSVALYKIDEPVTVEQTFYRTDFCETAIKQYKSFHRVDARTIRKTVQSITNYSDLKF